MIRSTSGMPYLGRLSDRDIEQAILKDDVRRAQPWTVAELEQVRDAALAMVRTRQAGDGRPSFDGKRVWELLGALDRAPGGPGEG